MDYTTQPLSDRVRKFARYVRLYGPRWTVAKVRAQYHLKRKFEELPPMPAKIDSAAHVGLLGCGNFAHSGIAYHLKRNFGHVIRGVMDVDLHRAVSLWQDFSAGYYTDDADRVISDPEIDLIFIASNHASHADYAVRALRAGKHVHIEKPHVIDTEQLVELCRAMRASPGRVHIGLNRSASKMARRIKHTLSEVDGPATMNWFVADHFLEPDHWYYGPDEGGRVFANLCHWAGFVYEMVAEKGRCPLQIHAVQGKAAASDLVVTYEFGDGSLASICYSAKAETFEGVREQFSVQRGEVLAFINDFRRLRIDIGHRRQRYGSGFRREGHEERIRESYRPVDEPSGRSVEFVWELGELFLKTREALATGQTQRLEGFRESFL